MATPSWARDFGYFYDLALFVHGGADYMLAKLRTIRADSLGASDQAHFIFCVPVKESDGPMAVIPHGFSGFGSDVHCFSCSFWMKLSSVSDCGLRLPSSISWEDFILCDTKPIPPPVARQFWLLCVERLEEAFAEILPSPAVAAASGSATDSVSPGAIVLPFVTARENDGERDAS